MAFRHKYYSDKSKQARRKSKKPWGGRYADGPLDNQNTRVFHYTKKVRNNTGSYTYYYPTRVRRRWASYKNRRKT